MRRRFSSSADIIDRVSREIEESLGELARADDTPLWQPFPAMPGRGFLMPDGRMVSPQQAALESLADELFFGGSPGGGKTHLLFGLALTQHHNSIIFRRMYTQLRGAEGLIEASRAVIGVHGHFGVNMWRDLPGNRSLEFGAVQLESHKEKYKGRAHDLKAFDEIPDFSESQYRFLIGWLRSSLPGQRTRVVCTGNPPTTEEGQWVLKYWGPWLDPSHPNPAKPGELRWFITDKDGKSVEVPGPLPGMDAPEPVFIGGEEICPHSFDQHRICRKCKGRMVAPRSRTFIPSSVEDNPVYMQTDYIAVLDGLPEPLRSQMRFGNFQAAVGDAPWQVFPRAWVLQAQARWRPDGGNGVPVSQMGCDPSRGGQDEFVNVKRHDAWVAPLLIHQASEAPDGMAGAALVAKDVDFDQSIPICIDVCGEAGPSVYDQSRKLLLKAIALNGSRKTSARDKSGKLPFFNCRAKWIWRFREWLEPGSGMDVALPPDAQMRSDLCAMRWRITPRGIQIEDKDEIKKRIGRSPDRGEGVIYSFADEADAEQGLLFSGGASTASASELSEAEEELARLREELGVA